MQDDDIQIYYGDSIKALPDGKVAGYLVRFTTDDDPDLTGDYFTKQTDFGEADRLPVMYQHGLDVKIGKRKIGAATIRNEDAGLWAEAQLNLRDEYEKAIYELAKAGKLGWSSGAASHTVSRVMDGKAARIEQWYIAEASLTPTPAEYRNVVMSIKSLMPADGGDMNADEPKENNMSDETKDVVDVQAVATAAAEAAVKSALDGILPDIKAGFAAITNVKDEADKKVEAGEAFKTAGDFLLAVAAGDGSKELKAWYEYTKATGLNEEIPSQGGFLVPPQFAAGILEKMHSTGELLRRVDMVNIQSNRMVFNAVDETSRADGSRFGGVRGYWLAEGGTKTASKPSFRQLDLKLNKVAALCYATDELLEDAGALSGWLNRNVPLELQFLTENAFYNGDGVGKPLGIMNSPALVSVTRVDANQVDATDLSTMWSRRYAANRDYVWLINPGVFPQLATLTVGDTPAYMPPGGFSGSPYGSIFGAPVIEVEYAPALGTTGDIMLVSLSEYQAISKASGIQAAQSIHVQFVTDETAFRFVYRVDGAPKWNTTLTGFDTVTRSPFVVLTASS